MAHRSRPWNRRDFIGAGLAGAAAVAFGPGPADATVLGAADRASHIANHSLLAGGARVRWNAAKRAVETA